jgi:hypothetical protein
MLGICGVGSLVTICALAITFRFPTGLLGADHSFSLRDIWQLFAVTLLLALWMVPLDFLGGYRFPRSYYKSFDSFRWWLKRYAAAVAMQAGLNWLLACLILTAGRMAGLPAAMLVVIAGIVVCLIARDLLMMRRRSDSQEISRRRVQAVRRIQSWGVFVPQTIVVRHRDIGFAGGIIGLGQRSKIVIPEGWFRLLSDDELALAIARRAVAIHSGSYHRGLLAAAVWNLGGFLLATLLPGAGVASVAELVTTFCGFTLWSFAGLLLLHTFSRHASLQIDRQLIAEGVPDHLIRDTAWALDQMQDGEPHRPRLIETIFHPVPSVSRRNRPVNTSLPSAWNVARTTLFFSWACFGMLTRAVHCNVGRPELWFMLPTD